MTTALLIWAYISVGNLLTSVSVIVIVFLVLVSVFGIVGTIVDGGVPETIKEFKHKGKVGLVVFMWLLLTAMYPSTDDLKFILGGTAIVAMSQVDGVSELPENLVNAANSFLEGVTEKEVTE